MLLHDLLSGRLRRLCGPAHLLPAHQLPLRCRMQAVFAAQLRGRAALAAELWEPQRLPEMGLGV